MLRLIGMLIAGFVIAAAAGCSTGMKDDGMMKNDAMMKKDTMKK